MADKNQHQQRESHNSLIDLTYGAKRPDLQILLIREFQNPHKVRHKRHGTNQRATYERHHKRGDRRRVLTLQKTSTQNYPSLLTHSLSSNTEVLRDWNLHTPTNTRYMKNRSPARFLGFAFKRLLMTPNPRCIQYKESSSPKPESKARNQVAHPLPVEQMRPELPVLEPMLRWREPPS